MKQIESEEVNIDSPQVIVNTGWTTRLAFWNTFGTIFGALVGLASLLISVVALWIAFTR